MITSAQRLLMARAGVQPAGSVGWLAPIASRGSANDYIHFLDSSGSVIGTTQMSGNILSGPQYYRYGSYYYVFHNYNSTAWSKINLTNFNVVSTGNINSTLGRGQFSPISNSQLVRVSSSNSAYYIFDMGTGTETQYYPYTAGDNGGIAQTHATLTFYNNTASGLVDTSDQVYWSSANGVSYNSEINYATLTGTSLSAKSDLAGAGNYSRNYALTLNSDGGLMWLFDSQLKRVVPSTSTATSINPAPFTETFSYSYTAPQSYSLHGAGGAGATGNVYGTWRASDGVGGYTYKMCLFDPLSSTSPSATPLLTYPGGGYYAYLHPEYCVVPLNEAGYVFIAYFDLTSGTTTIKSAIFNGSSQVGTTNTTVISSSYTDNVNYITSNRASAGVQSFFGPVLAESSTS